MGSRLDLSREQILGHRRRVGALDARLTPGEESLHRAAWAGLQDSAPRAAVISIHARLDDTDASVWEHPSLVQLWGPRFNVYVVAGSDVAPFTLGRLPDSGPNLDRAETMASRLHDHLQGEAMEYAQAGRALGVDPNALRYGAPTGTILLRWEGARRPVVWTQPRPAVDPTEARMELARRFLHVLGPGTPQSFGRWAGIRSPRDRKAFEWLGDELISVSTPIGEAWILATDEESFRQGPGMPAAARLLPSGDAYYLLWGSDRQVLVPDEKCQKELWTSRVWPGAVLVGGEVVGVWRRSQHKITIEPWQELSPGEREAVEAEAISLPIRDLTREITVAWTEA